MFTVRSHPGEGWERTAVPGLRTVIVVPARQGPLDLPGDQVCGGIDDFGGLGPAMEILPGCDGYSQGRGCACHKTLSQSGGLVRNLSTSRAVMDRAAPCAVPAVRSAPAAGCCGMGSGPGGWMDAEPPEPYMWVAP